MIRNKLANLIGRWAIVWTIVLSGCQPATPPAPAQPAVAPQVEAVTFSGPTYPPPAISIGQVQNWPATVDNHVLTYDSATGLWGPEAGGGASGTLNDLTDVIITAAATGEVPRYNGTNWVDSKLASTDLSDFAAAIVGTTDDIIAWNGSAWDDIPFVTAVTSEFGNGTDNFVLTTDGAGGVAWEATTAGSMLTPDGLTATTTTAEFNVKAYGASGLDTNHFATVVAATSTVSVKDSAGSAANSSLAIGQGVVVFGAGPACTISAPTVGANKSLVANVGAAGSTTYTYQAIAGDGNGGWTAKSADIVTTTGNATLSTSNYNVVRVHIPPGAKSVAIYKSGVLQTVLDCKPTMNNASAAYTAVAFSAIADDGGGKARVTIGSHGMLAGDTIELNATSSGDDGYDNQYIITQANGSSIDLDAGSWNAGLGTATGFVEGAHTEWADKGAAVPLHVSEYMPDQENPPMDWRGGIMRPRGSMCLDTASTPDAIFRVVEGQGDWRVSYPSSPTAPTEPTWPTTANGRVKDNDIYWEREPVFVPTAAPTSATNQALFTTVATTPTSSTFTTTAAPTVDVASNTLCVMHNDALAIRTAVAAIKTYGKGGTLKFPPGVYNVIQPVFTNTSYWTNSGTATVPATVFMSLDTPATTYPSASISVELDDHAIIRTRRCQAVPRYSEVTATDGALNTPALIGIAAQNVNFRGGAWEDFEFAGGLTEHLQTGAFSQRYYWRQDAQNVQNLTFRDMRITSPTIVSPNGITTDDGNGIVNELWDRCTLEYGGGDGEGTILPFGEFTYQNGLIWSMRRYSSHGLYWNIGKPNLKCLNTTFRGISTADTNGIQVRGSGGDTPSSRFVIANCTNYEASPSNKFLLGDSTTSNRVHNGSLSNNIGFNVSMVECREVNITGGSYGTITISEDTEDCEFSDFTCNFFECIPSDQARGLKFDGITCFQALQTSNLYNSKISKLTIRDPYTLATNLVSGLQEWNIWGSNTEYYLVNRATGGDPGVASPVGVRVRRNVTLAAGTLNALASDTWGYSGVEVQSFTITGTPTTGTFTVTFNGNTSGSITLNATESTVQTALRLVTGLTWVTVARTGTQPNYTYTVTMPGQASDPPQMTSTPTGFDGGGGISHATPTAYYTTVFVKMGDSQRADPDANPYGTVQTTTNASAQIGLVMSGIQEDVTVSDSSLKVTSTDGTEIFGGTASYKNVTFDNIVTEHSGAAAGSSVRIWEFGASALARAENVLFNNCTWLHNICNDSELRTPVRMALGRGGSVTFQNCNFPSYGSACDFTGSVGMVRFINNRVQSNEQSMTVDGTADTVAFIRTAPDLATATATPVQFWAGETSSSMPTNLTAGTLYYVNTSSTVEVQTVVMSGTPTGGTYYILYNGLPSTALAYNANSATVQTAIRTISGLGSITVAESGSSPNYTHTVTMTGVTRPFQFTSNIILITGGSNVAVTHATTTPYGSRGVFANTTDAGAGTPVINIGAGGPLFARFPTVANAALLSLQEQTGDNTNPDWFGESHGNTWRGSSSKTYAQIVANQDNYALDVLEYHRISSDAARDITGIDGGSPGKRKTLINVGAQVITLKNGATASADENEFVFSTGADVALSGNESIELWYDGISLKWRDLPN